ncbi:MarR family winged helix-turn-helix transcriptional regulator [Novosphingobium sp. B1]|uniref:MarR family winged helix-turn-helix transcriptional regulator n=1 Tax=Novosphingobium sp. B1 TaxID=1938756 RepID=UPI0009D870DE|nr:MarR family transcriptional regulator [Novosphingobium sp. B1]SMC42349.1 transcriptional regulator, MarR family [Novosphingobium sp. B1]
MKHPLDPLLGFHLVRTATMALRAVNQAYGDLGIRHPDAAVMMAIEANPGITQSAIGRMLNIQRSNMVPMVTRLTERDWIVREPGAGKTIRLFLSPEGKTTMPRLHEASRAGEDRLKDAITPETYRMLLLELRKLR